VTRERATHRAHDRILTLQLRRSALQLRRLVRQLLRLLLFTQLLDALPLARQLRTHAVPHQPAQSLALALSLSGGEQLEKRRGGKAESR